MRLFNRERNLGVSLRMALEDLGPIFIKFGQALSTRRDLLPKAIIDELEKLQDAVPPFSEEKALGLVEKAYGKTIGEIFQHFELKPLASASIAQVHTAELKDGMQVVVKIVRPNIERVIKRDIGLMYSVANFLQRYVKGSRRFKPVEVVSEFDKTIHDELDLMREAANASILRRNFEGSDLLYVPQMVWPLATKNIIVMERIEGIPISQVAMLTEAGINLKELAQRGVEIFFTQVFEHSFFHADMHPGNIMVSRHHPEHPKYLAVDFGIMGSLHDQDKKYLAENLMAFFNRDYKRVADLHVESGWVPAGTRVDEFEAAIRAVCEPIFERPLKEISFAQVLLRLFQTGRRFQMEIQPQLLLLQKTLIAIEGLGRNLYPDLDLWSTAKPYLEKWIKRQFGVSNFIERAKAELPHVLDQFPQLPRLIHLGLTQYVKQTQATEVQIQTQPKSSRFGVGFFTGIILATILVAGFHVYG